MNNLSVNLKNTKICEVCKERFKITNNRAKYCKDCYEKINRKMLWIDILKIKNPKKKYSI